jgi:hypothetical protein
MRNVIMDKEKLLKWIKKNRFRMDTTYGKTWEWVIIFKDLKTYIEDEL